MNNVARMVMLAKGKEMPDNRYYENESRFMDRRGKPHYDNGRYAPRSEGQYRMDGNYRSEYEPMYGEYDGGRDPLEREKKHRPPFTDPLASPMNKIGFAVGGEMEKIHEMPHEYPEEMGWRSGKMENGKAESMTVEPLTKESATQWVRGMENADDSVGAHWSYEQTTLLMSQRGIKYDPVEFYAAMNMMFSDYIKAAKKLGVKELDFCIEMAKAFLDDKDAPHDKLARYKKFIAQA